MGWFKKDPHKMRRNQIVEWMKTMAKPGQNYLSFDLNDKSGHKVAEFAIEDIEIKASDMATVYKTPYDEGKRLYRDIAGISFDVVHIDIGEPSHVREWKINGICVSVPDTCTSYDDFIAEFKETLIDIFIEHLSDFQAFSVEGFALLNGRSEISLNDLLSFLGSTIVLYNTFERTHNTNIEGFKESVIAKIRDSLITDIAYGSVIPTAVMEFLYSINTLFPCLETLDDTIFIFNNKQLSRPLIIKKDGKNFIRTDMLDPAYLRHDLAKKLCN